MYITEYEVLRIKLSFKQSNKAFCHIGWSLWPGTKSLSIFTSTELTDNKTNLDKKTPVIDFHILLITNWVKKVIHPGHRGTLEWWDLFCLRPIPRGHMCLKWAGPSVMAELGAVFGFTFVVRWCGLGWSLGESGICVGRGGIGPAPGGQPAASAMHIYCGWPQLMTFMGAPDPTTHK